MYLGFIVLPLQEHYKDLKEKSFFPKLIEYITSGPVVCMVCFLGFYLFYPIS